MDLPNKDFKAGIINMFRELKETMFKEPKENMTIMTHQIKTIDKEIKIILKEAF